MELRLPVAVSGFISKISKSTESLSKFAGTPSCQLDRYDLIAKKISIGHQYSWIKPLFKHKSPGCLFPRTMVLQESTIYSLG